VKTRDGRLQSRRKDGIPIDTPHAGDEVRGQERVTSRVHPIASAQQEMVDRAETSIVKPQGETATDRASVANRAPES
jgi:hypothetical protein